jgi:hypothetical protein
MSVIHYIPLLTELRPVGLSYYYQYRTRGSGVLKSLGWFAVGAAVTGSFLIPTFLKYGFKGGLGSTNEVVQFNRTNILRSWNVAEGILGREARGREILRACFKTVGAGLVPARPGFFNTRVH